MSEAVQLDTQHDLDLGWMDQHGPWDTKAEQSKYGLTLADIQLGDYGNPPAESDNQTGRPRGAAERPGSYRIGNYAVRTKSEIWLDNASFLYEEALQRQWSSATDIPWHTIEPLPEDVERAMCQLCTELCQQANVEYETVASWIEQMSYGYHEVKVFLASEVFDAARHFDVFRKRALSNGGGLGLESRAEVDRVILQSKNDWTSTSLFLHVLRGSFTQTLYRYGELYAHNPAEKAMFARCLQDKARHLTYSLAHIKYSFSQQPGKERVFQRVLSIAESQMVRDLKDPVLPESLGVIMGHGVEGVRTGMRRVGHLLGDFVRTYLGNARYVELDRSDKLAEGLAVYRDL